MTEGQKREEEATERHPFREPKQRDEAKEIFVYKDSGIQERHGYIPFWLILVVVIMTVWGIYYLMKYWTPA